MLPKTDRLVRDVTLRTKNESCRDIQSEGEASNFKFDSCDALMMFKISLATCLPGTAPEACRLCREYDPPWGETLLLSSNEQ
jgi:hypothetical protein